VGRRPRLAASPGAFPVRFLGGFLENGSTPSSPGRRPRAWLSISSPTATWRPTAAYSIRTRWSSSSGTANTGRPASATPSRPSSTPAATSPSSLATPVSGRCVSSKRARGSSATSGAAWRPTHRARAPDQRHTCVPPGLRAAGSNDHRPVVPLRRLPSPGPLRGSGAGRLHGGRRTPLGARGAISLGDVSAPTCRSWATRTTAAGFALTRKAPCDRRRCWRARRPRDHRHRPMRLWREEGRGYAPLIPPENSRSLARRCLRRQRRRPLAAPARPRGDGRLRRGRGEVFNGGPPNGLTPESRQPFITRITRNVLKRFGAY